MGSVSGENSEWDGSDSGAHEDKIFVSVRLRPLNERELAHNDVSDWDCINNSTIIFKNSYQERSMSPIAYTFDRVYAPDSPTREVYEDSAKKTVLSVLSGINSTIFAYGQTSSGKTYTMCGITEYAIRDMYNYMDKHREREFVMKFSAMEIYNEAVKDLLNPEATQLRLLDDPERGTVVEKLTEVIVRDSKHLRELLTTCEAHRQTGETSLNEVSSRSHQILRLTVESGARAYFGAENMSTLTASVNFVDLAGSERASQTLAAGTRLKEGSHINRSLLTLGTVIRKLSKGRNGHVPYRNSKLTRILQNSLGGNAKTAIICTMSPAHSYVEQSRNTLLFASCAKQVSTNAQVNVVMSEKALVKQLQKELARLENELKSVRNLSLQAASGDSASALKEKELLIAKMDKEIRDLTLQRDLAQAQAQLESMRQEPKHWIYMNSLDKASWPGSEYSASETSETMVDPLRSDTVSCVSHYSDRHERVNSIENDDTLVENNEEQFLADDTSPTLYIDKFFGPDPCQGWEKINQEVPKNSEEVSMEVQCIEEVHLGGSDTLSSPSRSEKEDRSPGHSPCSSIEDLSDSEINVLRSQSCKAILTTVAEPSEAKIGNENNVAKETESTLEEEPADIESEVSNVAPVEDGEIPSTTDTESSVKESSLSETEKDIKTVDAGCTSNQQKTNVTEDNEIVESNAASPIEDDLEPQDAKTSNNLETIEINGYDNSQDVKQSALEIVSNEATISNNLEGNANQCCDEAQDSNQPALEIVSCEEPDEAQDSKQPALEIVSCDEPDEAQDSKQIAEQKVPNDKLEDAQDIKETALDEVVDCAMVSEAQHENQPALEYAVDDGFDKSVQARDIKETSLEKIVDCPTVDEADDIVDCPTVDESMKIVDCPEVNEAEKIVDCPAVDEAVKTVDCPTVNEALHEKQPVQEKAGDDGFDKAVHARDIKETALEKIVDCPMVYEAQHEKQPALEKAVYDVVDKAEDTKKSAQRVTDIADQDTKPLQKIVDGNLEKPLETKPASSDWSVEFERQKREIVELWDACNTPLVHRTYFFLLFQGDPSDAIYMEVELRRLSFLKNTLHGPTLVKDAQLTELATSLKALNREREMLTKQMMKKLTAKERETMYEKWGIEVKSKQRRAQLCRRLFTDSTDLEHVKESASIVAKLMGIKESGKGPKAMVGLTFSQKQTANFRSFSWRRNSMI